MNHTPQSWFALFSKTATAGFRDFYFSHLGQTLGTRQDGLNVEEINLSEPERSIRLASS